MEKGIDTAGLKREFFSLFVKGIVDKYCHGDIGNCIFKKCASTSGMVLCYWSDIVSFTQKFTLISFKCCAWWIWFTNL